MSVVKMKAHDTSGRMTHTSAGTRQQQVRFNVEVVAFDVEERVNTRPLW